MSSLVHIPDSRTSSSTNGAVGTAAEGRSPSLPNSSLGSSTSPVVWSRPDLGKTRHSRAESDHDGDVDIVGVEELDAATREETVRGGHHRQAPQATTELGEARPPPPLVRATPPSAHPSHTPTERPPRMSAEDGTASARACPSHSSHAPADDDKGNGNGATEGVAAGKQLPTPVVARRRSSSHATSRPSASARVGAVDEMGAVSGQARASAVTGTAAAAYQAECDERHAGRVLEGGGNCDWSGSEVRSAGEMWGTFLDTPSVPSEQPTPSLARGGAEPGPSGSGDEADRTASADRLVAPRAVAVAPPTDAGAQPAGRAAHTREPDHNHTLDPPVITASDYSDRQRLLYHITFLGTQLQRAQLQLQEQQRTLTILHSATAARCEADEAGDFVQVSVARAGATAAALAAREEAGLLQAFEQSLLLFDPAIAQAQINRLDNALAQVSLLREAELHQLRQAEHRLTSVQRERDLFATQIEVLTARAQKAEAEAQAHHAQLARAQQEVQHLRLEETRLARQLTELQSLANDDPFALKAVRVRNGGSARAPATGVESPCQWLEEEEATARQALLQELFWDPLCIAFDAGLTWLSECELRAHSSPVAATAAAAPASSADVDLMLLRQQQDELGTLRGQVDSLTHRLRIEALEKQRWRGLYESEQRRSEAQAADFLAQLRSAYEELQRDRESILAHVQQGMAEEARQAFSDGRLYERRRQQQQQRQTARSTSESEEDSAHDGRPRIDRRRTPAQSVESRSTRGGVAPAARHRERSPYASTSSRVSRPRRV